MDNRKENDEKKNYVFLLVVTLMVVTPVVTPIVVPPRQFQMESMSMQILFNHKTERTHDVCDHR